MREENFIFSENKTYKGATLDQLLSMGFYRMQHMMFTTHHALVDSYQNPVDVFWLRTNLHKLSFTRTAKAIQKKCADFQVECKAPIITAEIENLYSLYREMVSFSTSKTCRDYLYFDSYENPFDSMMIEVRRNGQLIAVGFFDQGKKSIAGILNFYHPDYRRFSLGKYLMLQKIDYAIQQNMDWYYTGYISTQITKFDYKIFPKAEALEVYLPNEQLWESYTKWDKAKLSQYVALVSPGYRVY